MTIISFSAGMAGYTFVINNKNGNMWATGVEIKSEDGSPKYSLIPEVGINLNLKSLANAVTLTNGKIMKPVGVSTSINFGSIVGGEMNADEIDRIIGGSSVGIQACHYGCIGGIYTKSKDKVVTYGLGTSQIGMSGGNMVKVSEENKQKVLSLLGTK